MKKYFATFKKREVTDVIPIKKKEFIKLIFSERLSEIYHCEWSEKTPFIIIDDYNDDHLEWRYSIDKNNKTTPIGELYDSIQYQGITNCYFEKQ